MTPSGSRPSKVENHRASDRKSGDTKGPTCYSCSGPHYLTDKKCPDHGKPKPVTRMYVARESSAREAEEDQGHPLAVPCEDASKGEEHLAAVHSDSEEGPLSKYGSALSGSEPYGSQYSSEGEMYNLDSDDGRSTSVKSSSERFAAIRELATDYLSDDCPSLQEVSDSEGDALSGSNVESAEERTLPLEACLNAMRDSPYRDCPPLQAMSDSEDDEGSTSEGEPA